MRLPLLFMGITTSLLVQGQLNESFSDSNFTVAPSWAGTPGGWIVNPGHQLQSSYTTPNSSCWISTANSMATGTQWDLWLRLNFATSSANYADIWILSAEANPETPGNTGYFIRVGGTLDEVSLFRKDATATVKIIDGADGAVGASDNELRLRLARTPGGIFYLFDQFDNGAYRLEGIVTDNIYTTTSWFGLLIRQSSSSFFAKHYFDDISIRPFEQDTTAPVISGIHARSDTTLEVIFSESVTPATALTTTAYAIQGIGAPFSVYADATNDAVVHLQFAQPFPHGASLLLSAFHIRDIWGNELVQDTDSFEWYTAQRHDIVFTELMPDPTPVQGLPGYEYVEIQNTTAHKINLAGWRLATPTTTSSAIGDLDLQPGQILVITATPAAFAGIAGVQGLQGFPALDNEGTELRLLADDGRSIHALAYEKSWYRNPLKDEGGWSLECIDPHNPCGGALNWQASTDVRGGTPGIRNSIDAINSDTEPPQLLRTYTIDSTHIAAIFNEPLDSLSARLATYTMSDGASIVSVDPVGPLFQTVKLQLAAPMAFSTVYQLSVDGIRDCTGNEIGEISQAKAGRPQEAVPGSVVFNELLYQPFTGGSEYIEWYVTGESIIDLSRLYMATRNSSGVLSAPKRLTPAPELVFPGEYRVSSSDTAAVRRQYAVSKPSWLMPLAGMPSLPDDGGTLVLLNNQGEVVEEIHYDPDWHFALISDAHGVSLERLQPAAPAQDATNWHSAAATAGYGTPTSRNSQYRNTENLTGLFTVTPSLFSPDNDGIDDQAFLEYALPESGYVANINLFDAFGRMIRPLVRNAMLGRMGRWAWNGLDDQGRALPAGIYIVWAEFFNLLGKRSVYKRTVVLAKKW
jgi:hypothetical protein